MARKVGLALAAGGARGLAHIGVLQVLQREKVPIDIIGGVSMGALVAAAYAAGTDLDVMAKLPNNLTHSILIDVMVPLMGLIKGDKALEFIGLLTHHKTFAQLNIPLAVVATDIERREKVIFKEGNVAEAVRASISIPGIFQPVRLGGRLLVDGAVIEKVPVEVVHDMGADVIIAVDVKFSTPEDGEPVRIENIYEIITQSLDILENEASKHELQQADLVITPKLQKVSFADFHKAEDIIEMGRLTAEEQLEEIWQVVRETRRKYWTSKIV